jgi:transporter family-2 protein
MIGFIMSIIAGAAMSIQGVFNTRLSEKIGLYESNTFVQGTAFVISLIVMLIFGKGNIKLLTETNKLYWLGGVLGMIITVTVMLGIKDLSPVVSISVILISQLTVAALIDAFGIMGSEKVPLHWNNYLGFVLMVGGMMLFKLNIK